MRDLAAIFKAYDIRGVHPSEIDAAAAEAIGRSFARFAGEDRVVVARDMRPSGVELVAAFTRGVTSTGADVVDIGLASTDLLYFASGHLDAPGAMFTASHNPARYNGIKLCLSGARPVGQDTGLAEVRAGAEASPEPSAGRPGGVSQLDLLEPFANHVRSFVDASCLRPLKVVADVANGMGGLVVPKVFAELPFDLEVMYPDLDGTFPNHPADPIQPENLRALRTRVLEVGADVGLAFDGDADRVFLVDDRAEPVSGSTTTSLVAKAILEANPGAIITYNLICSKAVPELIEAGGGKPVRTRVGHSFIKAVMASTGAVFGGEHSGHYYFRDNYRADSGLIASMFVLEQLSKSDRPLSDLRRDLEPYSGSGEVNVTVEDGPAVIERVAAAYAAYGQDTTDGLTVDIGDWWFNLRPSNTEPLLRVNLEAADKEEVARHLDEVLALVKGE